MSGTDQIVLTESQLDQLADYQGEKGQGQSVLLRPAQNPGDGYVEAVLLDTGGEPTPAKRLLFP